MSSITLRYRPVVSALGSIHLATETSLRPWLPNLLGPEHFPVSMRGYPAPPAGGTWDGAAARVLLRMAVHHQLRGELARKAVAS